MSELSTRYLARMQGISHSSLYDMVKLMQIANERGSMKEFEERIASGEKTSIVMADLMPDVLAQRKVKQQINQYRSTTRWLLDNGFDPDDLIRFIRQQL